MATKPDLGRAGATLQVPGPDTGDEAYEAHSGARARGGLAADDRDVWEDSVRDGFEELLLRAVESAASDLGLSPADRDGLHGPRMDHDRRFASVAWGGTLEVGCREAEGSFEVAVHPAGPWRDGLTDVDRAFGELVLTGRAPEAFVAAHEAAVSDVSGYLRSVLARDGLLPGKGQVASRLTSGLAVARASLAVVGRGMDESLAALDPDERLAYVAALQEDWYDGRRPPLDIHVAVHDPDREAILVFEPGGDPGPVATHAVPEGLAELLSGLYPVEEGVAAIPATPETLAWAASVSGGRRRSFVVMAEEYARALKEPCVVSWDDDGVVEVEVAPEPGRWPHM